MKILKYKKGKRNEYQIITDKGEYVLFDDMIIKYELLLKKELKENPPINEKMIRAMYMEMGRKPSEAQIKRIMASVKSQYK